MGKKSTASEHLNQLHWAQRYPKGMGKKGTQVPFDASLPVHAHCMTLNWTWSLPEIVTSKESDQRCAVQRGRPFFVLIIECPTICR